MSVSYYFYLICGVPVDINIFLEKEDEKTACAKGHLRPDKEMLYCPKDGSKFMVHPKLDFSENLKKYSKLARIRLDGTPEDVVSILSSEFGELGLHAINRSYSSDDDEIYAFGVRLGRILEDGSDPNPLKISDKELAEAKEKVRIFCECFGLTEEPALYMTQYISC